MIVSCKMVQCPFNGGNGHCAKRTVVSIDENGMCSVIWKGGQGRELTQPFNDTNYPKDRLKIIEGQEKEVKEADAAMDQSKDPLNEAAAYEQSREKKNDEEEPVV